MHDFIDDAAPGNSAGRNFFQPAGPSNGIPSAKVMRALLMIWRNCSSDWASTTPCALVTVTIPPAPLPRRTIHRPPAQDRRTISERADV